ncbi:hypothetical protein N187_00165 [Borrelia anserina Es]|nr:hypothetical protein N187_00165 [Borrelia anserina Es]
MGVFMKRMFILVLFLLSTIFGFAQGYDEVNPNSSGNVEKMLLYETYKKSSLLPFLLNLFVGFGVGSLVQGDITGGLLSLGFDTLGLGLVGYGAYSVYQSYYKSVDKKPSVVSLSILTLGGVTMALTRIVEVILPFTYVSGYNKRLQQNLGIMLGGLQPGFDMNFNRDGDLMFDLYFTKRY